MNPRSLGWRFWKACRWYTGLLAYYVSEATHGLVFWTWILLREIGLFLGWWWQSWSLRLLLQGLPALLLGGGAVVLTLYLKLTPASQATDSYMREGQRSYRDKDYETAQICFERLAAMNPDKQEYRFWLMLTAARSKQEGRALALLSKLAPPDRQGYGPAHLFQAEQLLKVPNPPAGTGTLAEGHLVRAIQADQELIGAHALLGQYYVRARRFDEAEPHLLKAVQAQPILRLALAGVYETKGNKEEARRQLEQAAHDFGGQVKADLDNNQARILWVQALAALKKYPDAVRVLKEGLTLTSQPIYRQLLAGTFVAWSDQVAADPKGNTGDRLALLEEALRWNPMSEEVPRRLFDLAKAKGEEAAKARSALNALLAQGQSVPTVHMLLGLEAWERGAKDQARQHMEQAYKLSGEAVIIANNLAWLLAHAEPPDLERALELSNAAVQRSGGVTQLRSRDTRGRVLLKLGRWMDALADLEAALPVVGNKREAHLALAKVYQELGNKEMAAEHRRLAEPKPPAKVEPKQ